MRLLPLLVMVLSASVPLTGARLLAADLPALGPVTVPAAAGGMAPRLTQSASGTTVLSWLEPLGDGFALRYSTLAESGWTTPTTVASGNDWFVNWADFPSVVPVTEEFWVAHWLVRRPAGGYAYDVLVALSNDGGATWSKEFKPHSDDTDSEHGFVSIYPMAGAAGLVWLDGRETVRENGGMTLRSATLNSDGTLHDAAEIDDLTCDCCQTAAVMTADGAVVAYRDRTETEVRDILVSRKAETAWTAGELVAADNWVIGGCPVNGPVMANSNDRTAIAWFTAFDDVPRVRYARSSDGAATFDSPVDVVIGDTLGRVGLVLLPDGSAIVSAIVRDTGEPGKLALIHVDSEGHKQAPFIVAAGVHPFSVPQVVLHGDTIISAWTTRKDDVTEVHSARIPLAAFGSLSALQSR